MSIVEPKREPITVAPTRGPKPRLSTGSTSELSGAVRRPSCTDLETATEDYQRPSSQSSSSHRASSNHSGAYQFIRSAIQELEQQSELQAGREQELLQRLEQAESKEQAYLLHVNRLEAELSALKTAEPPADLNASIQRLQEEQDLFLASLLDEHEQELAERESEIARLRYALDQANRQLAERHKTAGQTTQSAIGQEASAPAARVTTREIQKPFFIATPPPELQAALTTSAQLPTPGLALHRFDSSPPTLKFDESEAPLHKLHEEAEPAATLKPPRPSPQSKDFFLKESKRTSPEQPRVLSPDARVTSPALKSHKVSEPSAPQEIPKNPDSQRPSSSPGGYSTPQDASSRVEVLKPYSPRPRS